MNVDDLERNPRDSGQIHRVLRPVTATIPEGNAEIGSESDHLRVPHVPRSLAVLPPVGRVRLNEQAELLPFLVREGRTTLSEGTPNVIGVVGRYSTVQGGGKGIRTPVSRLRLGNPRPLEDAALGNCRVGSRSLSRETAPSRSLTRVQLQARVSDGLDDPLRDGSALTLASGHLLDGSLSEPSGDSAGITL